MGTGRSGAGRLRNLCSFLVGALSSSYIEAEPAFTITRDSFTFACLQPQRYVKADELHSAAPEIDGHSHAIGILPGR